jgi:hypothetical protein
MVPVSTKIKLQIYRRSISELAEMDVQGVRILCAVLFKTDDGYTEAKWAIIDTGEEIPIYIACKKDIAYLEFDGSTC